jgi:hypothetical protein
MLTVVPYEIANALKEKQRVKDYNTLPQINKNALEVIRKYICNEIGYNDLPMACLIKPKNPGDSSIDLAQYLPMKANESVLFFLEMPDDMIVSVEFKRLLEISEEMTEAGNDRSEVEYLSESLQQELQLGIQEDSDSEYVNYISFIPFLDYNKCKFYAAIGSSFTADKKLDLPGVGEVNLRELGYFAN